MTKYIKPRRQSKFLSFLCGFLTGFVSFILIVVCVGFFAFYGLTIKDVENFTGSPIIENDSGFSFVKNLTLNEIVSSISKASKSEEGFSISSIQKALGEDIDINLGLILPSNIDVEKIDKYFSDYTEYNGVKDVPIDKLPKALTDVIKNITYNDVMDIAKMASLDLEKYYKDFGLENFDALIEYVCNNEEIKSIKDLKVMNTPAILSDIITLARVNDVINLVNSYSDNKDKVYQVINEMLTSFKMDYSIEEIKQTIESVTNVFGENASVLNTIKNISLLFNENIDKVLGIENKNMLQFIPFTNEQSLQELNSVLNTYFPDLLVNDLHYAQIVNINGNLIYDEKTKLSDVGKGELKDLKIGDLISVNSGIFSLDKISSASFSDLAQENVKIFDNITLRELQDKNIIDISKANLTEDYLDKTLLELESLEEIKDIKISQILNFRIGLLYNPRVYSSSISGFLGGSYLSIRLSDLKNLGIEFNTTEGEGEEGFLTKLPLNTTIKDIMNLDVNKIFKDTTVKELITSGGNQYAGVITALYDIKIVDLFNKNLLDCFENTHVTIGDILGSEGMDNGILSSFKDIEIYNIKSDINKLRIGDVIGGLNVNEDYDSSTDTGKKYVIDNNPNASTLVIGLANYKISEISAVFTGGATIGDILDLPKDESGNYISDNKILASISKFTLNSIMDKENGIMNTKLGELLGLTKNENNEYTSDNKILLAISDLTINELMSSDKVMEIQVGKLMGLDKDENGKFVSPNKTLLAIADFTLSELTEQDSLSKLQVGSLLGLSKDESGNYISDNKTLLAIANFTLSELSTGDKLNKLKVGDILGLSKDESGNFVGGNKTILSIADFTISELSKGDKLNKLKIGDLLGLNKNEDGNYISENKTLLAIANLTIEDLSKSDSLTSIQIGSLLGLDKDSDGNYISDNKILLAIANKTIDEIANQNALNTLKVGDLLGLTKNEKGEYVGDNKILLAIADFTLNDLTDNDKLTSITIGSLFGLEKDESGNYISDNKILLSIANFTLDTIINDANCFDNLLVGDILGLEKDENGEYISSNKVLLAISKFKISELGTDKLTSLTIGEMLSLSKDANGNFVSSNKTLLAIANITLNDLINNQNCFADLKIGDILGLEKDLNGDYICSDDTIKAISNMTISELTGDEGVSTVEIGKLLGMEKVGDEYISDNTILLAIAKYSLNDLKDKNNLNSLKIGDLIGLDKDASGNYTCENNILLSIANFTLGDLDGEDSLLYSLKVGDVLGMNVNTEYNSQDVNSLKFLAKDNPNYSPVMLKIANVNIGEIGDKLDSIIDDMEIGEVLGIPKENGIYVGNKNSEGIVTTPAVILCISPYKIKNLSSALDHEIKIGDLLGLEKVDGKFKSDNQILLAIADFTLDVFASKTDGLSTLKIGDILGMKVNANYDKNDINSQKFLAKDNTNFSPVMLRFANLNINDIESNLDSIINDMEIGELLGIPKENGVYIGEKDSEGNVITPAVILCISKYKVNTISSALDNEIKIGDMLGLEKDNKGNYLSDNKVLLAIANFTLSSFTSKTDGFATLKVGDILGMKVNANYDKNDINSQKFLAKDNTSFSNILIKLANMNLNSMNTDIDSLINDMEIGEVLGIPKENGVYVGEKDSEGIVTTPAVILCISPYKIKDLSSALDHEIKIGDLLGLSKDSSGNYLSDNNILLAIANFTLNSFTSENEGLSTLKVGDILGMKVNANYDKNDINSQKFLAKDNTSFSNILIKLANMNLNNMNTDLDSLINDMKIGEVLNIKKDASGNYIGDSSTPSIILCLSNYKLSNLSSAIDSQIKIGDLFGLNKVNGKFVSDNKTLLAIADFTIKDFTSETTGLATLKIGDILGLKVNSSYNSNDTSSQKFLLKDNSSYTPLLIKIANISVNNIDSELDSIVNDMTVGEILNIQKDSENNYVGDGSTSSAILAMCKYTLGNLSDALNNDIKIGDLLGLKYDYSNGTYEASSPVLEKMANETLLTLNDDMENIIKSLTLGDCLNIRKDDGMGNQIFDPTTPKIVKSLYDVSFGNIANSLDNLKISDILEINGVVDNQDGTYTFPDSTSLIIKSIYTTKIKDLSSTFDSLTIGQVCGTNGVFEKIASQPFKNLESALNDMKIKDMFNINSNSNSILALLDDNTTLGNLSDAKINVSDMTIKELINYGLIEDNGYNDKLKNATINEILSAINNKDATKLATYFG